MTPRPARLAVIVHRQHLERAVPAHSHALFLAAGLRSLFNVWSLEGRSTCPTRAKRIYEGCQANDPDRRQDDETLPWPRSRILGNVPDNRHHDVGHNSCRRQDQSHGETKGHPERPQIATHVRDGNPHQPANLGGRPNQASPSSPTPRALDLQALQASQARRQQTPGATSPPTRAASHGRCR